MPYPPISLTPEAAGTLEWVVPPAGHTTAEGAVTLTAAAATDTFANPLTGDVKDCAARALISPPSTDWQLSARLRVEFTAAWDAGGLFLWSDDRHWAKLTFEQQPGGVPAVYSVVTAGLSDDAVGPDVTDDHCWLRISRVGSGYTFHAAPDGRRWRLIRQFALDGDGPARVGVSVQSPVGNGCVATFDNLTLSATRLAHLFDGR